MCTKKLKQIAILLILSGVIFSCSKKEENNDDGDVFLKITEITEIKVGKNEISGRHGPSLFLENEQCGISLRVENINDYRCPIGVECCWAGNAEVQFSLSTDKGEYDFTLELFSNSRKSIVIENIIYRLMDILPYPVHQKEHPVIMVKILVSDQSILADTQWKLNRYQNHLTSSSSPQIDPYIIHFKNDFTIEFPFHCRVPQGNYVTGIDGSIYIDNLFERDTNCERNFLNPIYEFETSMVSCLSGSTKFTIIDNQLIIKGDNIIMNFDKINY